MAAESKTFRPHWPLRLKSWPSLHLKESYQREILLIVSLAFTAYYLIALGSFSPIDPSPYAISLPAGQIDNLGGVTGAYLAGIMVYYWGLVSLALPLPLLIMTVLNVAGRPNPFGRGRLSGCLLLLMASSAGLQRSLGEMRYQGLDLPMAGQVGEWTSRLFESHFGSVGHDLLVGSLALCGILLVVRRSLLVPLLQFLVQPFFVIWRSLARAWHSLRQWLVQSLVSIWPKKRKAVASEENGLTFNTPLNLAESPQQKALIISPRTDSWTEPSIEPCKSEAQANIVDSLQEEAETGFSDTEKTSKRYEPPPLNIFRQQNAEAKLSPALQQEFEKTATLLLKILADFHVEGEIVAIQPGPVVTVYEFQPKAGTKLSKVNSLIEDIALALKVDSIFIHPVSGKRALGIQVPNYHRQTVYLGDVLQSPAFQKTSSPLTFAMGQSLNGESICGDLATMPHLLMAGQTGSGKSVAINTLLCSIILKAQPQDVRMILVDPKILELKIYEGIPHLLMPVITEATKASLALKWACLEMDRRYQLMELARVRHISGFNQFWQNASKEKRQEIREQSDRDDIEGLPYIVIVIDELADLMLTAPKDVESSIQRLAQKARASGIHLVLATQRPSVDVITGVIKANLPCRASFKVFSRGDSRTILDCIGSERLLGKGDMLFLKPGSARLERIQGAFLDDDEVVRMVEAIKIDSEPDYNENAIAWIEEEYQKSGAAGDRSGESDDLDDAKWDEALYIAQSQGHISASYLQRVLKIGYNRAARIVEAMASQGLIGRAEGSKPRKWLGPDGSHE